MFVSSVDVEEGMAVSRKKKKNTSREWEEYQEQDGKVLEAEEGWLDPESFYADSQPVPRNNEFQSNGIDRELSYATTERAWSSYRKVDRWEMLSAGYVVGWWVSVVRGLLFGTAFFHRLMSSKYSNNPYHRLLA